MDVALLILPVNLEGFVKTDLLLPCSGMPAVTSPGVRSRRQEKVITAHLVQQLSDRLDKVARCWVQQSVRERLLYE